jgi:hypothetical protein
MQTFEKLTLLSSQDLDNHALSLAASEAAIEAGDETEAFRLLRVARQLRWSEQALVHDGVPAPSLDKLNTLANLEDTEEDEFKAHYAVLGEIERMAEA